MNIINYNEKYVVVNINEEAIAEFGNLQDAQNYILNNTQTTLEKIKEYPFYEVDEHGQPIG